MRTRKPIRMFFSTLSRYRRADRTTQRHMTCKIVLRRLLICWWGGCDGHGDYDEHSVYWRCTHCGKVVR
jgi:hypothetical protein